MPNTPIQKLYRDTCYKAPTSHKAPSPPIQLTDDSYSRFQNLSLKQIPSELHYLHQDRSPYPIHEEEAIPIFLSHLNTHYHSPNSRYTTLFIEKLSCNTSQEGCSVYLSIRNGAVFGGCSLILPTSGSSPHIRLRSNT